VVKFCAEVWTLLKKRRQDHGIQNEPLTELESSGQSTRQTKLKARIDKRRIEIQNSNPKHKHLASHIIALEADNDELYKQINEKEQQYEGIIFHIFCVGLLTPFFLV